MGHPVDGLIVIAPLVGKLSMVISVSVCLSVCLCARISQQPYDGTSPNLLCMLAEAVARGVAMMLPVLLDDVFLQWPTTDDVTRYGSSSSLTAAAASSIG